MAAVEATFADGVEPWTNRAISQLDQRFAQGTEAGGDLRLTCQRLESAFQKVCTGSLGIAAEHGGLTDEEFTDWVLYGLIYTTAREPAFRVLLIRYARIDRR